MRTFLDLPSVRGLIPDATSITRLEGGSTKGVYRVTRAGGGTVLVYRWHPDENFWPAATAIDAGPFGGMPTRDDFLSGHRSLSALGVRVPEIVALDGDLAVIEDVRGGKLEEHLDGDAAAVLLARLRATLLAMHSHRGVPDGRPEDQVLERGRRSLTEAARRVPGLAARRAAVEDALTSRYAAIEPRAEAGLIHGELGPDHVMVDDDGQPVLIDIEGTMIFDAEWEHVFLEIRFGDLYGHLRTVPLDPARMRLYRLVMCLSLVAGPLLLVDGDFPRPEGMRDIAAWNLKRVLADVAG
ncbi:phosphotransferase [Actinoplanes sp. NPDC051633]|uniref:phosphotransferase family protein n=1 Tax=Actinoplanes sp. NPDC051633 TaxID=3155670 RepID=UPI0034430F2E